jgi:DNA-binding NarL/FixJ family response regulator
VNGAAGEPIRLLIADDHPVVRDGLTGMFVADPDFSVVGEAADGSQALRLAEAVRPDVILMDLRMPGMDGVTAIAELARRGNPARVLVLTTYDTDSYVLPAIEAGATGYLLKDAPRDELLRAVRAAAAGQSVLAPSVATRLMSRVREPAPEVLSQRELEVLALVAGGSANRETAARLFISEATVKTHLLHIYAKLGVTDRAAAVAEAFNRGLLTPVKPDRRLELQPSESALPSGPACSRSSTPNGVVARARAPGNLTITGLDVRQPDLRTYLSRGRS